MDDYSYGSGVQLNGHRAQADVSLGALRGRIPLQAVEDVTCVSGRSCPASRVTPQQYGLMGGGYPDQGFPAIIGARLADRPTPNPLIALGVRRWIVHLPQRGRGDGALVLNPDDRELEGFTPLRPGAGPPGTVAACLRLAYPRARATCGATLLDTGATQIDVRGAAGPPQWRPGQPGRLELIKAEGGAAVAGFDTGDAPFGGRASFTPQPDGGAPYISAGTLPFYAYDILFDAHSRTISVRANADARAVRSIPE